MNVIRVILFVAVAVFLLKYLVFPLIFVLANFVWKLIGVVFFIGVILVAIKMLDSVVR